MKKENALCSTMPELLALMTREWGSRKTGAVLHRYRSTPSMLFVREHFDDGKGHSGAFSSEKTPITEEVFQRALDERYISGKLEPGYVSTCEFLITELGKMVHGQFLDMANIALENLFPGKGMRACDIAPYLIRRFPAATEERAAMVLDELVRRGYTESHMHQEQKFYFRVQEKVAA